jgi:hypothetical protein
MRKITILLVLSLSCATNSNFTEEYNSRLSTNFCYALQAVMQCHDLSIRLDTEGVIQNLLGPKFRSDINAPYAEDCMLGFKKAIDEINSGVCQTAWEKFGCYGSEESGLIQQSPLLKNPILCRY